MADREADVAVAPRSEKLSFRTKAAYAIGDLGNSAGPGTIIPFWYLYFLTDVVRLDPRLAGVAILLGKIWDAVNDPLVGALSDRTRSRWGRRRPYLLFGSVPFGVMFALLWIVPPIQNQVLLCIYFALMYVLFDTAFTFIGCPYQALTPELTLDHDERTSLLTFRMAVSIVAGLLTALLLGEVIFPSFPGDEQAAFMAVGVVCGAIFVVPTLITFFGTREREEFQVGEALNPLEGLRYVLRNAEWRYTLAMGLLSWMPVDIASAVFPYFLVYWIGMTEGDANLVLGVILAILMGKNYLLPARPAWNTWLLPLLYLASAAVLGLFTIYIWAAVSKEEEATVMGVNRATLIALAVQAVVVVAYVIFLAVAPYPHPLRSPARLVTGDMALAFWGGVVVIGLLIPLGLTARFMTAKKKVLPSLTVAVVGLICVLVGGVAFRALFYLLGSSIEQFL